MYGSKGISMMAEKFIKELHLTLKSGTSDSRKDWFAAGIIRNYLMRWAAWILLCPKKLPVR